MQKEEKRIADLEADLNRAVTARERALQDSGLALRMQAILQADLDALRDRFQLSEAQRVRQEVLLRKLTPRLQEAARQLHLMQLAETAPAEEPPPRIAAQRPEGKSRRPGTAPKKALPPRKKPTNDP